MRETIAGIVLLIVVIGLSLLLSDKVIPDLSGDGGYKPCGTGGHPLWQDC